MILALDTATRNSGIALFDGRRLLAELAWYSTGGQTTELTPRLSQLLAWQGLKPTNLEAVAVSLGPGSYSGLRVALSMAKGMSLSHGLPLLGVPTLDATAYPHLGRAEPVCAIVQAGRGQLCWALYSRERSDGQSWQPITLGPWQGWRSRYMLTGITALASAVDGPTWFAGELGPQSRERLAAALSERCLLAPPSVAPRHAGSLAELGWLRLRAGDRDDPASLSPIYLREP